MKKQSTFKRLVPYIRQFLSPYKKEIVQAFLFLTLAAGAVLSVGFGLRYLVNEGVSGDNPQLLKTGFVFLLSTSTVLSFSAYFRISTTSWLAERVVNDLRKKLFSHLIYLDQPYYDQARTGDLLARLNSDTTILLTVMTSSLSTTVRSFIQLFGAGIMLVVTSPKLTAVVLLVIPFVLSPIGALGRRVRGLTKTVQDAQGLVEATATDYLQAFQAIKTFVKERSILKRFSSILDAKMSHVQKRIRLRAFLVAAVIFLAFSSVSLVMWLGGQEVVSGRLNPGDLSAFLFFALIAAGSLNSLSDLLGELQTAAGALERLVEIIEVQPSISEPSSPKALEKGFQAPLIFENVSFTYPTQAPVGKSARVDYERPAVFAPETESLVVSLASDSSIVHQKSGPVLRDFTLTIQPVQTLAIVGPSGAGKTTLFHLLLRFYDPESGRLLLGGTPLKSLSFADLRNLFSVVPQEAVIFNASLRENILFGSQEEAQVSEDALMLAVHQAALSSFIESLPHGLETMVGERGVRLSGGQKQRLAIARAFLKKAPFLLLDEATNALDAENESHIQNALQTLMSQRTTLVIAHRLSTIQKADHIIVLDQGRLVEQGSHSMLLAQKGLYFQFFQRQFENL